MADHSKIFTYEVDGLSYSVTVYEEGGAIRADISVIEGAMDVNAIYYGDDDFSGKSASLDGSLNMNGARLSDETVQWDDAVQLSSPGLGPEGSEKETFLSAGDTLTIEISDVQSLDEIDVFGIRATSTTTEDGSIKGVSGQPEEPEEPDDLTFGKVFFGEVFDDEGNPVGGTYILAEGPDGYGTPVLPEGTEPTFENYVDYFESKEWASVTDLTAIVFYDPSSDGTLEELFRIEAPEGGFTDAEELLAAYDEVILAGGLDLDPTSDGSELDLIAALTIEDPGIAEIPEEPSFDFETMDTA